MSSDTKRWVEKVTDAGTPEWESPPVSNGKANDPPKASAEKLPTPVSAAELIQGYPHKREPIIEGLCRRGETVNVIGAPKAGKSWFITGMMLSVAAGLDWFGRETTQGKVLFIDNELHPEELSSRLLKVASAMAIPDSILADNVDVLPLRGQLVGVGELQAAFSTVMENRYSLASIDAFYRVLPAGMSENDNAAMAQVYNTIDRYARDLDCSIVLNHHSSKGDQSGKSVTDVGSGAGSISRAADTHMIVRAHEQEDCAVLESVCRSFPPNDPSTIQWQFPLWQMRDFIEPKLRQRPGSAKAEQATRDAEAKQKVESVLSPSKRLTRRQLQTETGMGPDRINRAIASLQESGAICRKRLKKRGSKRTRETFQLT